MTNALGHTRITKTDPAHGQALANIDPNGLQTTNHYDPFGRVDQITPPLGTGQPIYKRFATCENNADVDCSVNAKYRIVTQSAGTPDVTEYKDQLNRVILSKTKQFDDSTVYHRTDYDALGRRVFESIPSSTNNETLGTHYTAFDPFDRLTTKVVDQTNGQALTIEYGYGTGTGNAHRTQVTVASVTRYRTYGGDGQLIQTTDALGGVTRYAYDSAGNPIVLEDANQSQITATYNDLGQKLWVKDPNMGLKSFAYDSFGQIQSETDAKGVTTGYQYDELGRLLQRSVDNSLDASFTYDASCLGMPSTEVKVTPSNENYSKDYSYDDYCRPKVATSHIDGENYAVTQHYDANYGRVKGITYPLDHLTLAFEYNNLGYQKITKNASTGVIYREITATDLLGNWTTAQQGFDPADPGGTMTIERSFYRETGQMVNTKMYNASGNLQQSVSYTDYDPLGNLTQMQIGNQIGNSFTIDSESYAYDDLHRLIRSNVVYDNGEGYKEYNYAYDAVGNFRYKSDFSAQSVSAYQLGNVNKSAGGNAGPNAVRSVMLANGKGLRYYSYDLNGNLVNDGTRAYTYNAFNKPIQITIGTGQLLQPYDTEVTTGGSLQFAYGANQLRYKQIKTSNGETTTTIYVDKLFERIISSSGTVDKFYVGDIAVVTKEAGNSQVRYIHRDRLGSMVGSLDEQGNLLQHHSYDPFGKPRDGRLRDNITSNLIAKDILDSDVTNRGFTDHEHLDDAQLIHMNGRVYDYNLGRFLSVDPFIQEPGNSQSMNPYSYIMNNPLAGTDPSGYMGCAASRIASACARTPSHWGGTGTAYGQTSASNAASNNGSQGSSSSDSENGPTKPKPDPDSEKPDEINPRNPIEPICASWIEGCSKRPSGTMFSTGDTDSKNSSLLTDEAYYGAKAACGHDNACKEDVQHRFEKEWNDLHSDRPVDQLGGWTPSVKKKTQSKKQNIRLPDTGSGLELEASIGDFLTVVVNSQGIDAKGIIEAGGMKVEIDKSGVVSVNGVPTNLQALGINKSAFKVLSFGLTANKSGGLDWQVSGKLFGGAKVSLKGSAALDASLFLSKDTIKVMQNPDSRRQN